MASTAFRLILRAAQIALAAGLVFGLLWFALSGSAKTAIAQGVLFGVLFGVLITILIQRSWPGGSALNYSDRMAVVRSVRRGESVNDRRLAPAVLEYVQAIRRATTREARNRWGLWVFLGLGGFLVVDAAVKDHTRQAVIFSILSVWFVVMILWLPRRRERRLRNAAMAEASARTLLQDYFPPAAP